MSAQGPDSYPLPDDPALSEVAAALRDAGHWGYVVDDQWRLVYATDEIRRTFSGNRDLASFAIGKHLFAPEAVDASRSWRLGSNTIELQRVMFIGVGPLMLTDTPGGRDALREIVDSGVRDLVDGLLPGDAAALWFDAVGTTIDGTREETAAIPQVVIRVRDATGRLRGTAVIGKPAPGMATISTMTAIGDLRHFERMQRVVHAGRRPAAILFADLEGSTSLAKRLSTAKFFALGRRLVRAADRCIVDAGGLVGRHVGDGVVAFFLTEISGSDSAAAHACITAARELRVALRGVAERGELEPDDVVARFGLHWGSGLYVGNIATAGRTEVTALGDEVNEAARIEACASGGRVLASKSLIERLGPSDATALGLDPDGIMYTPLAKLDTATAKARRDAPAIPVCDVAP